MAATTTLITPAENRFFRLSEQARRTTSLQQLSGLLREHVTVKVDSPFLIDTVRNLIMHDHAAWLTACSHEWQLLASLPYVVNPSDDRQHWQHCELCHKPVRYEYHVQNKHDQRELVVGSECVKKFMNAETRYLMVITTEDNFYAVAQYQSLTAQAPAIPVIMFKQPWFTALPATHQAQAQLVRHETSQTVTTYLKRRTQTLPLTALAPNLKRYTELVALETATVTAQQAAQAAKKVATQRQQRETAQQVAQSAEQDLRQSQAYRQYLRQLAGIIVQRPTRPAAKQQFSQLTPPATKRPLVNAYQFGLMVTEYAQTHQIQVRRLAMLDRQFVAALDQQTQQLDAQQTTRFYDDVFNSCWGWNYHQKADQLADWERLLATRWGTKLTLAELKQATELTSVDHIQAWLTTHADTELASQLRQRLEASPKLRCLPRTRLRRSELREFCRRELATSLDLDTFIQRFKQIYQLSAPKQALNEETLAYYYIAKQHSGDHQAALAQLKMLLTE
ncbi:hypothetical protein RA086_00595 [Lactiplantibacillus sp. WILCCON 0030]|uniref:Uncharacterized protein n=1 Tax=Lactiplantibacillus brownii TaxID=3069269 RepID=A0ABU1A580_9LACO|nr:hypothetical protein [Lactiplantibacillus brownii]MDQ7936147.1 hypothetical protein [Lactiplantibacillus brownii]